MRSESSGVFYYPTPSGGECTEGVDDVDDTRKDEDDAVTDVPAKCSSEQVHREWMMWTTQGKMRMMQ